MLFANTNAHHNENFGFVGIYFQPGTAYLLIQIQIHVANFHDLLRKLEAIISVATVFDGR